MTEAIAGAAGSAMPGIRHRTFHFFFLPKGVERRGKRKKRKKRKKEEKKRKERGDPDAAAGL